MDTIPTWKSVSFRVPTEKQNYWDLLKEFDLTYLWETCQTVHVILQLYHSYLVLKFEVTEKRKWKWSGEREEIWNTQGWTRSSVGLSGSTPTILMTWVSYKKGTYTWPRSPRSWKRNWWIWHARSFLLHTKASQQILRAAAVFASLTAKCKREWLLLDFCLPNLMQNLSYGPRSHGTISKGDCGNDCSVLAKLQ